MGEVVDDAMEVDLIGGVKFVEQAGLEDAIVVGLLDG